MATKAIVGVPLEWSQTPLVTMMEEKGYRVHVYTHSDIDIYIGPKAHYLPEEALENVKLLEAALKRARKAKKK